MVQSMTLCLLLNWGCSTLQTGSSDSKEGRVTFHGVQKDDIISELKQVADFSAFEEIPQTEFLLQRQAQNYVPDLKSILSSHGYYGAEVDLQTTRNDSGVLEIAYDIETGVGYIIKDINVEIRDVPSSDQPSLKTPEPEQLGITRSSVAEADAIRSAGQKLKSLLREQGFAFAETRQLKVSVDHEQKTIDVILTAYAGPLVSFGKTVIQGLERVEKEFVRSKIPWEPGDRYDPEKVRNLRQRLVQTPLFSLVQVLRDTKTPRKNLPMRLELTEADPRTISAGVGYNTDRGIGLKTSWEHRNLQGHGERLRLALDISEMVQEVKAEYRKPWFLREDQALLLDGAIQREDTDAYRSTSGTLSIQLERRLSPDLTIAGGPALTEMRLVEEETDNFALLSFPFNLEWDRRNDVLDPSKGWRLSAAYAPFKEILSGDLLFHKSLVSAHWYGEITPSLVLALRSKVGTIWGEDTRDIPANERFYAGGGGSVRGYPFQSIGPRRSDEPAGGRSIAEISTELRWRSTDKIGLVCFLDGGNVYESGITDMDGELIWGTGLGIRYYTPIGPLRLDVGFPLNDPDHVDDNFQIYISLGQAF